jgi:hypothetical protein
MEKAGDIRGGVRHPSGDIAHSGCGGIGMWRTVAQREGHDGAGGRVAMAGTGAPTALLTHCAGGKSHPPKGRHEPHQCKCPRSGEGMSFLVRALRVRPSVQFQQTMPAAPPGAGASSGRWTGTLCSCVAAFCCCTTP